VEANSTGGQGSRRAVTPSDDNDDDTLISLSHLHLGLTSKRFLQFHIKNFFYVTCYF
jgi:hypothetical protein